MFCILQEALESIMTKRGGRTLQYQCHSVCVHFHCIPVSVTQHYLSHKPMVFLKLFKFFISTEEYQFSITQQFQNFVQAGCIVHTPHWGNDQITCWPRGTNNAHAVMEIVFYKGKERMTFQYMTYTGELNSFKCKKIVTYTLSSC